MTPVAKDILTDSLHFRHACKVFAEGKIPQEDLHFILEAGRLSPSSFGMEHWHFIVVQSDELKMKLKPACWNQEQITTCSDLVIITAKIDDVARKSYYEAMFGRRGLPLESLKQYLGLYQDYIDQLESITHWASAQCTIAVANMMSYAALIGIDSCPIEGFEREKVVEILALDTTKEHLVMMVALGYRLNPQSPKHRLDFDTVVSFR